jgi:hypothetical protein
MIFKSKRDPLFLITIYGVILILIGILIYDITKAHISLHLCFDLFDLLIIAFLLWIFYGTYYLLDNTHLSYFCGPIKGKIEISTIKEITPNKTMWVGLKPATGRKGLIIKYDKYDEIYISPINNDIFIAEILKLNPAIKIH